MARILVTISPGADVGPILGALEKLGATGAPPAPELPDVVVAEASAEKLDEVVKRAVDIPGVLVAEPDVMRFT